MSRDSFLTRLLLPDRLRVSVSRIVDRMTTRRQPHRFERGEDLERNPLWGDGSPTLREDLTMLYNGARALGMAFRIAPNYGPRDVGCVVEVEYGGQVHRKPLPYTSYERRGERVAEEYIMLEIAQFIQQVFLSSLVALGNGEEQRGRYWSWNDDSMMEQHMRLSRIDGPRQRASRLSASETLASLGIEPVNIPDPDPEPSPEDREANYRV